MIFLVDVDEVLAGFSQAVLDVARKRGFNIPEIKEWDLLEAFPPDEKKVLEEVVDIVGFCTNLPVLPGSREGIAALRALGCEVFAVTTPWNSATWAYERQLWLVKNFGIDKAHTIFTKAKHLVRGDFLLDDRPALVSKWQESNPQGLAILWSTPFNADVGDKLYRCGCWDEVLESVEERNPIRCAVAQTEKFDTLPLDIIQREQHVWSLKNFGPHLPWQPLLGIHEEIGELSHSVLKREQGIRGTCEEHNEAIRDAVGDITIYLSDFCSCNNIDLNEIYVNGERISPIEQPSWRSLLETQRAAGYLSLAYLDHEDCPQNAQRGYLDIREAVGGILFCLLDFCRIEDIDLLETVSNTWRKVRERDWTKNKKDGT